MRNLDEFLNNIVRCDLGLWDNDELVLYCNFLCSLKCK